MATEATTTNVQTAGKTLNVAGGNVNMRKQQVVVRKIKNSSQRTIIYDQRQIPSRPEAAFVSNHIRLGQGGDDVVYDDRARMYLSKAQSDELTEKNDILWLNALPLLEELEEAIEAFRVRTWESEEVESSVMSEVIPPWDEVVSAVRKELKRARSTYKVGYLRQARTQDTLVSLDQNLASFLNWVKLLRSDERRYLLCTAFKVIFEAAADDRRLNGLIFWSMAEVAILFRDAKYYIPLYSMGRPTTLIEEKTVELLNLVTKLLKLLLDHAVTDIQGEQQIEIRNAVSKIMYSLRDMNMEAKRDIKMRRGYEPVGNLEGHPALLVVTSFTNLFHSSPYPKSGMIQLMMDASNNVPNSLQPPTKRRRTSAWQGNGSHAIPPAFSTSELVECLAYDAAVAIRQAEECLSLSDLDPGHLRQLSSLTQTDSFKKWLSEEKCSSLLIHGNFDQVDGHSPLSYLCARLVNEYAKMEYVAVLHYFCCLQTDRWDPRYNAAGIMSQMVGQLLANPTLSFNFDLSIVNRRSMKKFRSYDLTHLCKLFLELIHQLRHTRVVILCLLDSISVYETEVLQEDTRTLLATLQELVNSQRRIQRKKSARIVFKLLVTDASSTKYAYEYFRPDEVLNMHDDLDDGNEDVLEIGA